MSGDDELTRANTLEVVANVPAVGEPDAVVGVVVGVSEIVGRSTGVISDHFRNRSPPDTTCNVTSEQLLVVTLTLNVRLFPRPGNKILQWL